MKIKRVWILAVELFVLSLASWALAADAPPALDGVWSATAEAPGGSIPFRLELRGSGDAVSGHFFDGPRATNSSSEGSLKDGRLHLSFPSYSANLDATIVDGRLDGAYVTPTRTMPIHAVKAATTVAPSGPAPAIAGEWIVATDSDKGEKAWRLIVKQTGAAAEAAILRIDGDTGDLDGRFENGAFHLSH